MEHTPTINLPERLKGKKYETCYFHKEISHLERRMDLSKDCCDMEEPFLGNCHTADGNFPKLTAGCAPL